MATSAKLTTKTKLKQAFAFFLASSISFAPNFLATRIPPQAADHDPNEVNKFLTWPKAATLDTESVDIALAKIVSIKL